jgi:hypothetical protein
MGIMSEGFGVPAGVIPKGFPGEKGIMLRPWEVYALLAAKQASQIHQELESRFPTRFALVRPMKPQPDNPPGYFSDGGYFMKNCGGCHVGGSNVGGGYPKEKWQWHRRQHLWVKETWQIVDWERDWESGYIDGYSIAGFEHWESDGPQDKGAWVKRPFPTYPAAYKGLFGEDSMRSIAFRADRDDFFADDDEFVWRPSTTMPRWASRFDLVVCDTKGIRLQEIDGTYRNPHPLWHEQKPEVADEDAEPYYDHTEAYADFKSTWDAYYGPKGLGWDTDPWVYIVSTRIVPESEYLFREVMRLRSELRKHDPKPVTLKEVLNGNV